MNRESGVVLKYFPELSEIQKLQFGQLGRVFPEINSKVNLISRKDVAHLGERHILHSLAIAQYIRFPSGSRVVDVGTGGGFPGIPLAVYFPEVQFTLVDSISKKIHAVKEIADLLELKNVTILNSRIENVDESFDFAVTRAVAPLKTLKQWLKGKISNRFPESGLICLKGGNLEEEINEAGKPVKRKAVSDFFEEDFFKEKFIISLPHRNFPS